MYTVMFLHLSVLYMHKCNNEKRSSPQKDNVST